MNRNQMNLPNKPKTMNSPILLSTVAIGLATMAMSQGAVLWDSDTDGPLLVDIYESGPSGSDSTPERILGLNGAGTVSASISVYQFFSPSGDGSPWTGTTTATITLIVNGNVVDSTTIVRSPSGSDSQFDFWDDTTSASLSYSGTFTSTDMASVSLAMSGSSAVPSWSGGAIGEGYLSVAPIPEPSVALLGALGLCGALRRCRRN